MRCTLSDLQAVQRVLTHDDVYRFTADDAAMEDKYRYAAASLVLFSRTNIVLMPNQHTVFIAHPITTVLFDVHVAVSPEGRGHMAIEAAKEAIEWGRQNTGVKKLMCMVPVDNPRTAMFAGMIGFRREGLLTASCRRGGVLLDQFVYGMEV